MSWNDDIKKIIELIPKIDAIYEEINKSREPASKPSETEDLKRKIDELNDKMVKLDRPNKTEDLERKIDELNNKMVKLDKLYKKRLDSALKTYTEIGRNGN